MAVVLLLRAGSLAGVACSEVQAPHPVKDEELPSVAHFQRRPGVQVRLPSYPDGARVVP
jgi:hypothetical protein